MSDPYAPPKAAVAGGARVVRRRSAWVWPPLLLCLVHFAVFSIIVAFLVYDKIMRNTLSDLLGFSVFEVLQPLFSLAAAWALYLERKIALQLIAGWIAMIVANSIYHDNDLPVSYIAIVAGVFAYVALLRIFRKVR